jgi:hypothetical protein
MTYRLDSSVLIDALNDRNGRPQFLARRCTARGTVMVLALLFTVTVIEG